MIAAPTMSITTDTYTRIANSSQSCGVMVLMLFPSYEGIQHGDQELSDRPRKSAEATISDTLSDLSRAVASYRR